MNLYYTLKHSDLNSLKISEIITDNQSVINTNIGDSWITHYDLMKEMETGMYPSLTKEEKEEKRDENVHIFLMDLGAYIDFPDNGRISLPQISMVLDFIKELSKYNREVPDKKKIPIDINGYIKIHHIYDINEIGSEEAMVWHKHLRSSKENNHEIIIGEKYSGDETGKKVR